MSQEFYRLLNVPAHAPFADVKAAYRRAAMRWHPDRHPEVDRPTANQHFQRIVHAYTELEKQHLASQEHATEDVFSRFHTHEPTPPPHKIRVFAIPFSYADLGTTLRIDNEQVYIPPGSCIQNHLIRRANGHYLSLDLTFPDSVSLKGRDVWVETSIPLDVALLGGAMRFHHWDGRVLLVKWPPNSFEGCAIRLKGDGIRDVDGTRHSLFFVARIQYRPLHPAQLEKIRLAFPPTEPISCSPTWS
jgi:DnaJ-class molecular chaperone